MSKNNAPSEPVISVNLKKTDVINGSKQVGLTESQAESLWHVLQECQKSKFRYNFSTVLLYFGGLIVFLSMTWFYTSQLSNNKSLFISISYALIFFGLGTYFWHIKKIRMLGGLLSSLGIIMVPLTVYLLQNLLNWNPPFSPDGYKGFYYWIQGRWVAMEICTLLVSCTVLYFIRFPFIMVLIYSVVWFISMDVTHLFVGTNKGFSAHYSVVSIIFGFLMNLLGFGLYRKKQSDFSYWSYLFGMFLCWTGLTAWDIQTELGFFTYFLINFAFLLLSGFFHRKIFMFFGSIGIIFYIGHLAYIFSDSLMFSYVLAAIGFSIIMLTAFLFRSKKAIKTIQ
jgi:hypothetical protein